jgi:hypothetical protein
MKNRPYASPVCILATPVTSFVRGIYISKNPLPPNKMEARGYLHTTVTLTTVKQLLIKLEMNRMQLNMCVPKFVNLVLVVGARGSVIVKALRYKPEGRGFDTRWSEFFNLPNPSGRTRPWDLLSI